MLYSWRGIVCGHPWHFHDLRVIVALQVNKRFDMSGAFQKLLEALNKPVPNVRQETYTRVFFERSLEVTKGFRSVMDRNFNAELDTVDMRGEPDSVRECVNSSVEKDTVGAIPQLLVSGVTDADTCAVFYDAVYVKASWDKAFPAVAAATEKHPFTECTATSHSGALASGSERAAELVRITGVYRHCRDAENKLLAVEVPLSSDKLSMVLFMADNTPSLRRFHKHLSLEQYERVLDKLEATGERISVLVPKMHVEESVQPSYTLRHMGFLDLLDEHAMLSGIASNLFVSDIIHKVSFTLDTTGITAAAAVSLSLTNFYTEELPKAYRDCQSSRPFIYVVKNKETDLILFMGAVQDI
ncbi:iris-like [Haemaphysalis longicornis]